MMKQAMEKILQYQDLTEADMEAVVDLMMSGDLSDIEMAGFLTGLRMKGECVEEIVGGARALRNRATKVEGIEASTLLDTCGTGGDAMDTFNISTGVAFVLAAAGVAVVKHGNRAVSSKSGSADVLEALGVNLDLSPDQVVTCVNEEQLGFFFAPKFHGAMKAVANARRTLGIRTVFNLLGPLANPAQATAQVIGVYDLGRVRHMAEALHGLGVDRAMVVHGMDGMDELTTTSPTMVCELRDGRLNSYEIHPETFGLPLRSSTELMGGDADENAQILKDIFSGQKGAKREILLLNSGASLYVAGKTKTIHEGIDMAAALIDSGAVLKKLEDFVAITRRLS
jgi:anthranilate phosphoribosyltransferase